MQQVVVGIQYPAAKESHRKFISQKNAQRNTLFHSSKIFALAMLPQPAYLMTAQAKKTAQTQTEGKG